MVLPVRYLIVILFFSVVYSVEVQAQDKKVVSSESSYILIQNNTTVIPDDDFKTELPFSILFPMFNSKRAYGTNLNQINLIGKIKKPEEYKKLYLNNKEVPFSEEGLFFKVLDLSPGKNVLQIKVVPKKGKTLIVNFFIEVTKEAS